MVSHVGNIWIEPWANFPQYIVACQAHPALVKIGLILAHIFHFNDLLVYIRSVKALRMSPVYGLKG